MDAEVIVVGGGPAGSAAAITLARAGRSVLLLDRQRFPRGKACGEAIPHAAVELLHSLGVRLVGWPNLYPVHRVLIASPGGSVYQDDAPKPIYTSLRHKFDAFLLECALECGARFEQVHVTAPIVERGLVVGVEGRRDGEEVAYRARAVIAADGATSTIARALRRRPPSDAHRVVALRAYVRGIADLGHRVELHFVRQILPGYAWIFPISDEVANVGIGMRIDKFHRLGRPLLNAFKDFLASPLVAPRLDGTQPWDVKTWQIGFGTERCRRVYGGCILVGDAGSFADPLSGAGIHNALLTGKLAAEAISAALEDGDVSARALSGFNRAWKRHLQSGFRISQLLQSTLVSYPWLLNTVVPRIRLDNVWGRVIANQL